VVERITGVSVGGVKLVDDKQYLIVTNDFIAVGGDGYAEFGTVPITSEGRALDEVLCDYITSLGTVNIAVEGRIKVSEPIIAEEPTTVS
jgi:2',3'-cyclic-nucleotide 2'-phosphodiesterase (5'-nucleotidase family)